MKPDGEDKQDHPIKSSQEAFALYFTFRMRVIEEMNICLDLLRRIMETEASGIQINPQDDSLLRLKSHMVSVLYMLVRDKMEYPAYKENFKQLKFLDYYLDGRKSLSEMSLPVTKFYLLKLRSLIEVLGYTKVERDKEDPTNLPAQLIGL